ncbi:helix-turn-helix transcriptional regulator [Cystobacter fuscus]|uniref:helix-turn-helix domain-containing protein n=1 Tax=Cystobacter fuscus TaxID=43 RepID=UPI002B2CB866|nr:helix-turn-helix transcriptional regulator [Cystobacter fuscus]
MVQVKQRQSGDPIPGAVVRDLRQRHGITQEQLAQRLGIRGGKSVISAWEKGSSTCEGPAAELLLRLLGGNTGDVDLAALTSEVAPIWERAENPVTTWRQVAAVPDRNLQLDRAKFATAFPSLSIPSQEHAHGFPFVDIGDSPVYGVGQSGWTGAIPTEREKDPYYLWTLKQGGQFLYREHMWENDPRSITKGHIHIRAVLTASLATTFMLRRLAQQFALDNSVNYSLGLAFNGIAGRGLATHHPGDPFGVFERPQILSTENHLSVSVTVPLEEIIETPVESGLALTGELANLLCPDKASDTALRHELKLTHQFDKRNPPNFRWLGFLDREKF